MDAKEILNIITDEDIINIMDSIGSKTFKKVNDGFLFQTICHNGEGFGKLKLHYHSETKTFFCYTNCGNIGNIYNLIMEVKQCGFKEAYNLVCEILGINNTYEVLRYGFKEELTDNSFIEKFKPKPKEKVEVLKIRDKNVLKCFWNIYHKSWIEENIAPWVMELFNIKFDLINNAIIIPHYDINNNLIGIRARNLNKEDIEEGRKYTPIFHNGELFNYPTGLNLFGINVTKEAIKKYKTVIVGESEKFVMQHLSIYKENSVAVGLNGSSLSEYQVEILKELGVENIILALDKEFTNKEEANLYALKIKKSIVSKLYPYFRVEIIWDNENLINHKDSPMDKGREIFEKLYNNRIIYKG